MRYKKNEHTILNFNNALDKKIVQRAGEPAEQEIYQARWVWYHTILAIEIAMTNVLLAINVIVNLVN
jgi:hypothetical protein